MKQPVFKVRTIFDYNKYFEKAHFNRLNVYGIHH